MKKMFLLLYVIMFVCTIKLNAQTIEVSSFSYLQQLFRNGGTIEVTLLNDISATTALGTAGVLGDELNMTINGNYALSVLNCTTIQSGGVFFAVAGTTITFNISDVLFKNNAASIAGGAIYATGSAMSFTARNDISFVSNISSWTGGGAMMISRGLFSRPTANFVSFVAKNIYFSSNIVSFLSSDGGGAIYCDYSSMFFTAQDNISFVSNVVKSTSYLSGGGALMLTQSTTTFNSSNILFENNTSASQGGAIYCYYSSASFTAKNDISFISNSSLGDGGAIKLSHSPMSFTAEKILFINNIGCNGGALFYAGTVIFNVSSIIFENNTAIAAGGAIYNNCGLPFFISARDEIVFISNSALYARGGAINLSNSSMFFTAKNISFISNFATAYGGAFDIDRSTISFSANRISFVSNYAEYHGGVMSTFGSNINFNADDSDMTIIFKDNYACSVLNDICFFDDNSSINFNANRSIILENGLIASGFYGNNGIINKTGSGALIFGGNTVLNVSYFNISDGDIIFLDKATFKGPSMVLPGTTLDMQNETVNTITVGVFSSTTNTKMDIWAKGDHDQIIAGSATVGGNLDIKARIGRYDNKTYTIILSTLTYVQGNFISTSANVPLQFTFNDYTSANAMILTVNGVFQSSFSEKTTALSPNQRGMAKVFDKLSLSDMISDDLADIITDAMFWDEGSQAALLSQASGYLLSNVIRNAAADSPNNEIYDKIRNHAREDTTNSGVWGQIKGGIETFKENENSPDKYKDNSIGIMAGYDRYIAENGIIWGAFARFINNNISQGDSSANGNKKGLGVYGGYIQAEWELKGMLLGSFDKFNTERRIAVLDRTAKGEVDTFTMNADIEGALKIEIDEDTKFKPYLGFELQNVNYTGLKETSAVGLNLDVKGDNYLRTAIRLGAGIDYDKKDWSIYGKLEGKYLLTGQEPTISSVFEGTNISFDSRGSEEGKIQLGLGFGGEIFVAQDWKLFANMNYYTAKRYENIYGNVGIRYMF